VAQDRQERLGIETVSYAEALGANLCYGWFDGQKGSFDNEFWQQRFTPCNARSKWSKVNRDEATKRILDGRTKPAGLQEVERAKADGRWEAAYDSQSIATVPDDLRRKLEKNDGSGVLRHARQREPLRNPVPDLGRQEARCTHMAHREVRVYAEQTEEALPLNLQVLLRGRHDIAHRVCE